MRNFDMHFHSTESDGCNTPFEILLAAKNRNLELIALTDHDRVSNKEFIEGAETLGIKTLESTEVSGRNYDHGKSLHMTYYAQKVSSEVHQALESKLVGAQKMMVSQIEKLQENGFMVDPEGYFQFIESLGRDRGTGNKYTLSLYMFEDQTIGVHNAKLASGILGRPCDRATFYTECLKEGGEKYENFKRLIKDYEPSLDFIGEKAAKDNALLSIAHPNFTFSNMEDFENVLPHYLERGVKAIEINSRATPEWIELIYNLKKKYGLILTAGSDNHKIGYTDSKHGDFGNLNPDLTEKQKNQILDEFLTYF